MNIQNKTVLVLGGWGLVGSAVARKLVDDNPKRIIITSLKYSEAQDAVAKLEEEFPAAGKSFFIPWGGDIFVRNEFREQNRLQLLNDADIRKIIMHDTMEELTDDIIKSSSVYNLLTNYKPEIIIDCINTATAIAYQDIYSSFRNVTGIIKKEGDYKDLVSEVEKMMCTLYIPQLIRHIQLLYTCMSMIKTEIYVKIGTSGTGGMGLNIPYTHSEEKPSRVLLSKSSIAGAHTLLLFLMGRTPEGPITKEIKPTAAIAWKRIEFGEIKKRGEPIRLLDIPVTEAVPLKDKFVICQEKQYKTTGETLKSVFIDTGENGIFSRGEFETITAQKQMEFVTPEEIAEVVVYEIQGGNTGHDIVSSLDHATLEPTYRAGYMQHMAAEKLANLEKEHNVASVAFELLGPPRLSKLLYEIHLISLHCRSMKEVLKMEAGELSQLCLDTVTNNSQLRSEILSIGIPILLPDGENLLRGNNIKIPAFRGENILDINKENIERWSNEGWVDLRTVNMVKWKKRISELIEESESISLINTSSQHVRTRDYWKNYDDINIGKICSWLFIHEEHGKRMKA